MLELTMSDNVYYVNLHRLPLFSLQLHQYALHVHVSRNECLQGRGV